MPERSFFFKGYQFPVCARCTGMIVGYFLSITTIPFASFHIGLLAMLCIPMILDGLVQLKTNYVSTNPKRFASGLLFGYGFLGVPIQIIKIIA